MNYLKTIAVSAFFILFAAGAVFVSGFLGMPVAHADAAVPAVAADECSVTQADIAQIAAAREHDGNASQSSERRAKNIRVKIKRMHQLDFFAL